MFEPLKNHPLVLEIRKKSDKLEDRMVFHQESHEVMKKMGELDFVSTVFETNLKDEGFLKRKWSNYEIPFLYVFENNHFYIKYHIFPPVESGDTEKAANIIHHHNNYILSSYTMFGPGYHTCQFGKEIVDNEDGTANMHLTKDFFHAKGEVNIVDSWEPHIVFNMSDTTTTLVLWSPDKKLMTDGLRNHPMIKPFKKIILNVIHALDMHKKIGVAPKDVKQYYVQDGKVIGMKESDYFGTYKEQIGEEVSNNYVQAICHFVQRMGFKNDDFVNQMLHRNDLPNAWRKWLPMLISNEPVPTLFGKEEINIPKKEIRLEDLRIAFSK